MSRTLQTVKFIAFLGEKRDLVVDQVSKALAPAEQTQPPVPKQDPNKQFSLVLGMNV